MTKLVTNIYRVSRMSCKGFQAQKSRLLGAHLWELCESDVSEVIRGILMKLTTSSHHASVIEKVCKVWGVCR